MTTKKTTKKATGPKATKSAAKKAKPAATNGAAKKLSAIDAAAKVLVATKQPMSCKALIEAMATKGLWTSPGGKTPHATLYSAIAREIATKGKDARFKKTDRGQFAANG
jgi:PleD family two-component response regulator